MRVLALDRLETSIIHLYSTGAGRRAGSRLESKLGSTAVLEDGGPTQ
jgi:hypothetical protein